MQQVVIEDSLDNSLMTIKTNKHLKIVHDRKQKTITFYPNNFYTLVWAYFILFDEEKLLSM